MTGRHDRSHDYGHLVGRWKKVARAAGLRLRQFSSSGGFPIYFLESSRLVACAPAIYLSAGIHGDEPASTEALVTWAEANLRVFKKIRPLIFPCLNPWGLAQNCRLDSRGRDLNRSYKRRTLQQVRDQIRVLGDREFSLAMMLHEDYDARGVYVYEVISRKPYWAEDLLRAAARYIGPDIRRRIEGRAAKGGIVRRRVTPDLMPDWPEAFLVHFLHAERTFTVETPSEFGIADRVAAHRAILDVAVKKCLAESARKFPAVATHAAKG